MGEIQIKKKMGRWENVFGLAGWMRYLITHREGYTQRQHANKADMTVSQVTILVRILLREGLLEKLPMVKRKIPIVLTPKGKRIKEALINLQEAIDS